MNSAAGSPVIAVLTERDGRNQITDRTPSLPFSLLTSLFGDAPMADIFSEGETVRSWVAVEAALAQAQAQVGVISESDAAAITRVATLDVIDLPRLWTQARIVGYPILPLVRMLAEALPEGPNGRVHYGATTQDIMDTGLSIQIARAHRRLDELIGRFGDALVTLIDRHRGDAMPARTHGQQAVPTTFGAKLAVLLVEFVRHRDRLAQAAPRTQLISLFGAGGTSAALGPHAAEIRTQMARLLGLVEDNVPWHAARDGVAEFCLLSGQIASSCGRFAGEVINLSRTEIGEVHERSGEHRGASSTMPQKENPIDSEAIIGMAASAGALASSAFRFMQGGHERSAGEWQIEWHVLPQIAVLSAGCLATASDVAEGLRIHPDVMRANLDRDGGMVMAEAYMIRLAEELGRERAHDTVSAAVREARKTGQSLHQTVFDALPSDLQHYPYDEAIPPEQYLGHSQQICDDALNRWKQGAVTS